jgi:hypothetical protein
MLDFIAMKLRIIPRSILFVACSLLAQSSAGIPGSSSAAAQNQAHSSNLGFSYALPSDWDVIDNHPSLADVQKQVEQGAGTDAEKRGIDCVRMALTARHGNPPSVVTIVALPFDCFGEQMTEKDLPGFAQGALEGVNNSFDVSAPVSTTYSLGAHSLWIERSGATVKGHAELAYTVETVCTILKKGAVCWMAMAADKDALATFENGAVTLDGDAQPGLVPATAFAKPSP